ncbi:MAG: hypothetical protein R3B47_21710 [Bacteroidia bacterium]
MPIFSNIVGIQLATTLQDHVMVEVDAEKGRPRPGWYKSIIFS